MNTGTHKSIEIADKLDCDGELPINIDSYVENVKPNEWLDKGMAYDIIEHLAKAFDISVVITISE